MKVYDYDTGRLLLGAPSAELQRESEAEGTSGAVAAYLDGETWQYVRDSDVSHYRENLREDVRTVYVSD
jgi:hypothetical protein